MTAATHQPEPTKWTRPRVVLAALAASTLLVHLAAALLSAYGPVPYGLHRDEYLYLALGRHLDWGYLEVPPGIALLAATLQVTVGTSLVAVRFVPALASAGLVLTTGLLARELGGRRWAILIAGLAALIAPVYLRAGTLFQPVIFDQLAWAVAAFFLARRLRTGDRRWWLGVGLACGLGLVFKYTVLLFGVGLFAGLLLTPLRRDLATRWPWAGAALAGLFATPNLIWQATRDWPLLRHLEALSESQLAHVAPVDFLVEQVLMMHPVTLPIWGAGLVVFFFRWGREFRVLGWTYVMCLALLLALHGKSYYLAAAYPMLLAGGAVGIDRLVRRWRPGVLRPLIVAVLVVSGVLLAPMGMPVLPPPLMAQYQRTIGVAPESETGESMPLPQDYADMLGWPEMAEAAARVYHALPEGERRQAILFGESYGHAGALDYHGADLGLPPAASTSSSYYLWGPPKDDGAVVLFLGLEARSVAEYFARCATRDVVRHPWAREGVEPIVVCHDPHQSFQALWPSFDPW